MEPVQFRWPYGVAATCSTKPRLSDISMAFLLKKQQNTDLAKFLESAPKFTNLSFNRIGPHPTSSDNQATILDFRFGTSGLVIRDM